MPDLPIPRNAQLVLVAGKMNPSMHHPQWYRAISAIDDKELRGTLKGESGATTPIVSQFQFGSPNFTITCQPHLWTIQSAEESSWKRMIEIASLVFAKTNNPSMLAYGLMVQRHIDTDRDVKAFLADSVAGLHLGLPTSKSVNTNITLSNPGDGFTITSAIQTSVLGDRVVFGLYHYDYPTNEIESVLDGRFDRFISDSDKFFADIVAAVNRGGAKGADHE